MATNFDIPQTGQQAVNTAKLLIKEFGLQAIQNNLFKEGIPKYAGRDEPFDYKSKLGTPIFTNLVIGSFTYTNPTNKRVVTTKSVTLDTVLLTVTQQKNIIKTNIQGRSGSVKEYISDSDYQVNIKVILTEVNGKQPFDQVSDFKEILDAPTSIFVTSRWLQNLGVNMIVVESYTFPQKEGGMSFQAIDINCVSDLPIELKLKV